VSGDEEYRFQPEDFEGEGGGEKASEAEPDRAPLVIVGSLGLGIGLFLADPFVDPVTVSGAELGLGALAAVVVALGLLVGGFSYARRGRVRLGVVHAVGGVGWLSVVVGATLSSTVALAVGGGALVTGAGGVLFLTWRSRA